MDPRRVVILLMSIDYVMITNLMRRFMYLVLPLFVSTSSYSILLFYISFSYILFFYILFFYISFSHILFSYI